MSNIRLFHMAGEVKELSVTSVALERDLQVLIENNMPILFGVTLLKSEFVTTNHGRMDSLGIDENYCPVIFEYKRTSNENVINQGLFYLDWLLDHKADFELLVLKTLGKTYADQLDWSMPRLICVAGDFTKYDIHAVKQINRNIDLVRYKKFDSNLLMLELVNSNTARTLNMTSNNQLKLSSDKTFEEQIKLTSPLLRDLYATIREYILTLGDDITENPLKLYTAFKKMKNIVCVEVYQKQILLHMRLDPTTIELEEGFTRDMRNVGHFGTGDLQVIIKTKEDFEKARYLIDKAYAVN
ncbi:DUF5655 domain-containing protein [Paenibacillus yanchengensis]|uniref:DUF5655 domain-containing protein n=1 Tax=Paenibacillus yanchengensis TaxID=2035833 RepID=A0ABW4YHB3_9BACL